MLVNRVGSVGLGELHQRIGWSESAFSTGPSAKAIEHGVCERQELQGSSRIQILVGPVCGEVSQNSQAQDRLKCRFADQPAFERHRRERSETSILTDIYLVVSEKFEESLLDAR